MSVDVGRVVANSGGCTGKASPTDLGVEEEEEYRRVFCLYVRTVWGWVAGCGLQPVRSDYV